MRDAVRDNHWENEGGYVPPEEEESFTVEKDSGPGIGDLLDVLMIQTALLMRIYDAQMKLLAVVDEDEAAGLWEDHNQGIHHNPQTMIPNFEVNDNENT